MKSYVQKIIAAEDKSALVVRLKNWGIKGGTAILDQGLFSGSNFVLSILLARWLSPADYGAFSIAFAVYLFFSSFYNALILEPMSIFATSRHMARLNEYFASQIVLHFVVTMGMTLISLIFTYAIYFFRGIDLSTFQSLAGVEFFMPLMLFIWLARRIHYTSQKPLDALLVSILYFFSMSGLSVLLYFSPGRDSLFLWFGVMGIASFLGSLNIFPRRIFNWRAAVNWKSYIGEQWEYGRWVVIAAVLHNFGYQVQIFILAFYLGLGDTGAFRAIQNLMLPMMQLLSAFILLATPLVSYEFGRGDFVALKQKSFRVAFFVISISVLYEIALFFGAGWLEKVLYGGKYAAVSWLFPWAGLVALLNAMETGYALVLRSLQRPSFHVINKLTAAIVGTVTAFVFVKLWALPGAVISGVVMEVFVLAVHAWLYWRWFVNVKEK